MTLVTVSEAGPFAELRGMVFVVREPLVRWSATGLFTDSPSTKKPYRAALDGQTVNCN